MTHRGHIKDGHILLDEGVELPEGAEVRIELVVPEAEQPAIWKKLLELAGTAEGLPPDMARNHNHYLYGTPKKS